jgi:hypothetical protein
MKCIPLSTHRRRWVCSICSGASRPEKRNFSNSSISAARFRSCAGDSSARNPPILCGGSRANSAHHKPLCACIIACQHKVRLRQFSYEAERDFLFEGLPLPSLRGTLRSVGRLSLRPSLSPSFPRRAPSRPGRPEPKGGFKQSTAKSSKSSSPRNQPSVPNKRWSRQIQTRSRANLPAA